MPGIAALWATYAFSTLSLKQAIGEGFQEIARSTAIRLAAAVDNEIDRATRLALVPLHIRQPVLLANERAQRKSTAATRLPLPREPPPDQHVPSSIAATVEYLEEWAHESSHYVRVTLVDQQGLLVASTDRQLPPRQADQKWWRDAMRAVPSSYYLSNWHMILWPTMRSSTC